MSADDRLAVVVARDRTQTVIDRLRELDAYDDDRTVQPWDDDSVAVPVTSVPADLAVRDVVRQVGEPRLRDLDDYLRERGWTDAEIDLAPASWAVVGSVVLVDVGDAPRPEEVGAALLQLHGEADTVLSRGPITGEHREPAVEVIAGTGDTETVHREHGTAYALDLAEVMFSPGNKAERSHMGAVVREARERSEPSETGAGAARHATGERERVLDMFAGIGYFTLPMARAGATVTAVERNPVSFRYLIENVQLNEVADRVQPYRADCRDVTPDLAADPVDRIVMGYYEAHEYLDAALPALAPGGVVHMHEATPDGLVFERPIERIEAAAADAGRGVEILDTRRVKSYSEGVAHVVVDARIE
ncbi:MULTISPECIES: class I SAM-dependent methyltransferase [Halomicrobium]|uniref:tRNA(Phe) (4-demethylwyosine(37)-C(7)) aminocarboxypropyltransferase n=2 Tax=Halomicrobium mukohataei TaxID=57705 RepID=C7P297_HALMD|nr:MULTISPECIES: class I SAM-dependent methyltransferase family protein [Halomicrobium]ACV47326.1 methyltransferase [Halomicrobium mukohataei DSM 12286]QCD65794.1 class I SAM-dependent methyltransferase family protein [Halomicrobium mukohataei]QFR20599.1 class I SAM-dependent methyltransferase family protein [Halomicrobium sp. ZPS1]